MARLRLRNCIRRSATARSVAAVAVVLHRRTAASCPVLVRKRCLHHLRIKRIMSAAKVAAAPHRCRAPNNKHITVQRATTTRPIATVRLLVAMAKIALMNAANATIIASIKSVIIIVIAPRRHHPMPALQCHNHKHPLRSTQQHPRHRRPSARSVS